MGLQNSKKKDSKDNITENERGTNERGTNERLSEQATELDQKGKILIYFSFRFILSS